MKITCTILLSLLALCSNAQAPLDYDGILHKPEFELDYQVIRMADSMDYEFLVITLKVPREKETVKDTSINEVQSYLYYSMISDFYVLRGNCPLYPIHFQHGELVDSSGNFESKTMQGLYLTDDLSVDTDSLELVYTLISGYSNQSNMNSSLMQEKVPFNPQVKNESDEGIPATKKWFKKYTKSRPTFHSLRSIFSAHTNCNDEL